MGYDPSEPRDAKGEWSAFGGGGATRALGTVGATARAARILTQHPGAHTTGMESFDTPLGTNVDVYRNPNADQLLAHMKARGMSEARGLWDANTGDLHWFDAYAATHEQAAKSLGVEEAGHLALSVPGKGPAELSASAMAGNAVTALGSPAVSALLASGKIKSIGMW